MPWGQRSLSLYCLFQKQPLVCTSSQVPSKERGHGLGGCSPCQGFPCPCHQPLVAVPKQSGAGQALLLARCPPSTAQGWDCPSHLTPLAAGSCQEAAAPPPTLLNPPADQNINPIFIICSIIDVIDYKLQLVDNVYSEYI